MKIDDVTIVGTGAVGMALGKNLVRNGVRVQLAARDLGKARAAATALGERARGAETKALGAGVGALLLAVPANAAASVLDEARDLAAGTIVVDCTNPIAWSAGPVHAAPAEGSMAAHLAARFPRLRVVKAFNTFGAEFHEQPALGATVADAYFAGDDAEAKKSFGELARTMGFEPVDVGPLRNAANLEALAVLWIHLASVGGRGRSNAFKLLAR